MGGAAFNFVAALPFAFEAAQAAQLSPAAIGIEMAI